MSETIQTQDLIVLIDDESDILENYSYVFKKNNFDVVTFSNGNSAIEYLRTNLDKVSIIISDFHMPNGNGHSVAQFVRKNGARNRPMMFFLSGYTSVDIEEKGWNLGYELIRKPIRSKDLLEKVLIYLSGRGPDAPSA